MNHSKWWQAAIWTNTRMESEDASSYLTMENGFSEHWPVLY